MFAAPQLALVSLNFTSFEYFWLALLGLSAAVMLGSASILKSLISLGLGLMIACVGTGYDLGPAPFYFRSDLPAGRGCLRSRADRHVRHSRTDPRPLSTATRFQRPLSSATRSRCSRALAVCCGDTRRIWFAAPPSERSSEFYPAQGPISRPGSLTLFPRNSRKIPPPTAMAARKGLWMPAQPHNSALSGAYVPAMVFGIPGDSITAIVIGVLYVKGLNPGPMVFLTSGDNHRGDLPDVSAGKHPYRPARPSGHRPCLTGFARAETGACAVDPRLLHRRLLFDQCQRFRRHHHGWCWVFSPI